MSDQPREHHIDLLAYFLTFRCYGTWLHGDARGSVDRKHNIPGTPMLPPLPGREAKERRSLAYPPMRFDSRMRETVAHAIRATCSYKDWAIAALNVRTNHVHVVVAADGEKPEEVMRVLKARATRTLREAELVAKTQPVWSDHGSTIYLWTEEQVSSAAWYVEEGQEKAGWDS